MTETYVTATDFRSHVAQITNCVAWRHDRAVVTRHGQEIGGFVCHEDLEFLRRYKPLKKNKVPSGDVFSPIATWDDAPGEAQQAVDVPPPPDPDASQITLLDPWRSPYEEVKALYEELKDRRHESFEVEGWFDLTEAALKFRERVLRADAEREARSGPSLRSEPPYCTGSTPVPVEAGTASRT